MRIAISQRVDVIERHAERRDALDQRWAHRIESLGLTPVPVPNALQSPQAWAVALGIEALLLTGGNDLVGQPEASNGSSERDRTEFELLHLAALKRWPVLGVCRGLQALNVHLGGSLVRVDGHVGERHVLRRTDQPARRLAGLTDGMVVNSFHSFGIAGQGLAPQLVPVLTDEQGHVEAAEHAELPWVGLMWHPEREPAPPPGEDWLQVVLRSP